MRSIKTLLKKLKKSILGTAQDGKTNAAAVKDIGGGEVADLNDGRTFTEIFRHESDDVLQNLAPTHVVTLFYLASAIGPAHGYRGIGWEDLFAERTRWRKFQWITMRHVKAMSAQYKTNDDCMFRVWFCLPGLVHVEVDDDGTWTVEDILQSFPEWMMIG